MIHAPTAGPIGLQPHGTIAKMINAESSTALTLGDVVVLSFASPSTYSATPSDAAALRNSCFARVRLADNNAAGQASGFIGVVVDLGNFAGAAGTEVSVQFGGTVSANVNAVTNDITFGTPLFLSNTAGKLSNVGGSDTDYTAGIALNTTAVTAAASGTINVLVRYDVFSTVV